MNRIVLAPADTDYGDMTEIGRVTIERHKGGVMVVVDGFKFEEPQTCRAHCAKAVAWTRDVLAASVEAERLVPGGDLICSSGMGQEDLMEAGTGAQP